MSTLYALSDAEIVARLPVLVKLEQSSTFEVIEHLVEMERRRLYLAHATSSLYRYCIDRLGYSEDAALKRHRVARLALRLPQTLEELRAGSVDLTGLFLLSNHLTEENAPFILDEVRGKSRRQLELLIARWFPRPDAPSRIEPVATIRADAANHAELSTGGGPALTGAVHATCPETGESTDRSPLVPSSPARWRIEFTAGAALRDKLERVRELLSHAVPSGDLGQLFERALDALLEKETGRRFGAGGARKRKSVKEGSRHVPVEIRCAVWERDQSQCTFVNSEGRRCGERRFLTLEHRHPFALGGPSSLENLCLLCSAHNLANGREFFGEREVDANRATRRPGSATSDPQRYVCDIVARDREAPLGSRRGDAHGTGKPDVVLLEAPGASNPNGFDGTAASRRGADVGAAAAVRLNVTSDVECFTRERSLDSPAGMTPGPQSRISVTSACRATTDVGTHALRALCQMGFRRREAAMAIGRVCAGESSLEVQQLLRKSLLLLVPAS